MGITDLKTLLRSMSPALSDKTYFICSTKQPDPGLLLKSLGSFKEKEGLTLILEEKDVPSGIVKSSPQSLITFTVNSDLTAVGFLAAISRTLADAGISINAISAYYHDHVFVPKESAGKALNLLKQLQKQT